jgi:hypothetical protein
VSEQRRQTDRELLEAWEGAPLMARRSIESELRKRMSHPGPIEEALVAALIRDTRKPPKPRRKPRAKAYTPPVIRELEELETVPPEAA